jgi:hypothetical protein
VPPPVYVDPTPVYDPSYDFGVFDPGFSDIGDCGCGDGFDVGSDI